MAEKDSDWRTSTLWRTEFRSVLLGGMRRGRFGLDEAIELFSRAETLLAGEVAPLASAVLALGNTSTCTAYDLEFVAVAQALGVPLVTNDAQVLRDFPGVAISPHAFAA